MKVIDRYVLKHFIRYLLFSLLVLVFIYIIINLFDNLGKYLSRNIPLKDILVYYLYLTPSYIVLLIPVAAIIGVFFIFGLMTKNRELVALNSAGLDTANLFSLILRTGVVIVLLTFLFQETIGIWAQSELFEHKAEKIDKRPLRISGHRRNLFYRGENNWVYFIKDFDGTTQTMKNIILWEITSQQRVKKMIDAAVGTYENFWTLENVTVREFDTLGNEFVNTTPFLKMQELKEKPADFLKRIKPIEEMNFFEIYKFVKKRMRAGEDVAKEAVELNYRFSFPIITIILLLISLPLSVVLRRGGIAIGLGLSIVLAFIYWGMIQSCRAYGASGIISPFLAAWLPNVIFTALGTLMMLVIRR